MEDLREAAEAAKKEAEELMALLEKDRYGHFAARTSQTLARACQQWCFWWVTAERC